MTSALRPTGSTRTTNRCRCHCHELTDDKTTKYAKYAKDPPLTVDEIWAWENAHRSEDDA